MYISVMWTFLVVTICRGNRGRIGGGEWIKIHQDRSLTPLLNFPGIHGVLFSTRHLRVLTVSCVHLSSQYISSPEIPREETGVIRESWKPLCSLRVSCVRGARFRRVCGDLSTLF